MTGSAPLGKGHKRLLEAWRPSQVSGEPDCGEPVGFVATTYTFDSGFFEDECLARFLQLEHDAREDGALFMLEREEKLAQLACGAVLVDQAHCRGGRSLRWDLVGVRVPGGCLHAKISLLKWARRLRLIIASANLTPEGYRKNYEVFGTLDYFEGSDAPLEALAGSVKLLRQALTLSGEAGLTVARRADLFLDSVIPRGWGAPTQRGGARIHGVFTGPKREDLFAQVKSRWPMVTPPFEARITSPFFDPPAAENAPARKIWSILRRRGKASVRYGVQADGNGRKLRLRAPESLRGREPREKADVGFFRLEAKDPQTGEYRALHLKTIWLEGEAWGGYMIGSSNFTSAGTGIGRVANIEANLLYLVDRQRKRKAWNELSNACLDGAEIGDDLIAGWQEAGLETSDPNSGVSLPSGFRSALYATDGPQGFRLELSLAEPLPVDWAAGSGASSVSAEQWARDGKPKVWSIPWRDPPAGLEVRWRGCAGPAWWPVNARAASDLPVPEPLRDLSLDDLIELLACSKPLAAALKSRQRRQRQRGGAAERLVLDPLRRFDSNAFLLARTQRMSRGFRALRERLEKPAATLESLRWRLEGPLGAAAVAKAIEREAASGVERAFLLAELRLELCRATPRSVQGCLSSNDARREIRRAVGDLQSRIVKGGAVIENAALSRYLKAVAAECAR